jgi:hypothetical protein
MLRILRLATAIVVASACGLSLGIKVAGAAPTQYVILNASNSFADTVEPGATIDQLGYGASPAIGEGPLLGVGLLFACGMSNVADFGVSSAPLGGATSNLNCSNRPRDIIGFNHQYTIRVNASGRLYDIDFLSWSLDRGFCVDADGGVSCAAASGRTSYNRVGPILLVPEYFCSAFENPLIHDDPNTGPVEQLILNAKERRTVPVKLQISDSNNAPLTAAELSVPPVATVMYTSSVIGSVATEVTDLLSPGQADDGNSFRYDSTSQRWIFNLSTKNLTATGTYTVGVTSGDTAAYSLNVSNCAIAFARK